MSGLPRVREPEHRRTGPDQVIGVEAVLKAEGESEGQGRDEGMLHGPVGDDVGVPDHMA
jgi:hypothetical protein